MIPISQFFGTSASRSWNFFFGRLHISERLRMSHVFFQTHGERGDQTVDLTFFHVVYPP